MNTDEAATVLGKSAWWVRRQCASGALRAAYFGGSWSITEDAITEYVTAHTNSPRPVPARQRRRRIA